MKKLYLHAGAHKTASSFLQSLLRVHKDDVKRKGLRVMFRSQLKNRDMQKCLRLISRGAESDETYELLHEDLLKAIPKNKDFNFLITSEDLFGTISIDDFYLNIERSLQAIKDSLPGWEVVFVFYVRKQADYIESVYSQYIHIGRSLSFSEFIGDGFPDYLFWDKVLDKVAQVVGDNNVVVKPFESIKEMGGDAFYIDFLESVGIDDIDGMDIHGDVELSFRANRSYSSLAVEIANKVNPLLNRDERADLRKFLQEKFSTATHARPVLFSDAQKNEVFDYYAESNRRLFEKFLSDYDGVKLGYF